jgi:hypothetical protein
MDPTGPYTSEHQITAAFSPEDFVPNGDLQKRVWQEAGRIHFAHDWRGERLYPHADTQVAAFWTPHDIGFAFWCKYTTLNVYEDEDPNQEKWRLWDRDVVEVFVNPAPQHLRHYYEFEVAPNNLWIDLEVDLDREPFADASWNSNFQHATRLDAQSHVWTCEIRIPLRKLGVPLIDPDREWRINFFRADGMGDDAVRRFLAWSPTLTEKPDFHVPKRFGIIRFAK